MPCHLRKRKCDGEKPSCASCARSQIRCEYAPTPPVSEGPGPSRIQTLQSRVEELESILVNMGEQASGLPAIPESSDRPPSPSSLLVDPESGEVVGWLQDILRPTMIANKRQYNLYLHVSTLRSPPRPLLHAMNLVACHILSLSATLDTRPTLQELEELKVVLLSRVYNGVFMSLEGARDLIAGAICAPALAAQYLLQVGRFAEAQWLASSAIRFAVSCGIHAMGSQQWYPEGQGVVPGSGDSFLVPASSAREHYDRCMSWWLAFAADGMVEIVSGLPSALRPEMQVHLNLGEVASSVGDPRYITTAFPLAEDAFESGAPTTGVPGVGIAQLLSGVGYDVAQDPSSHSVFAMRLKSMVFFQTAALINDYSRTNYSGAVPIQDIDSSISTFISTLPSLSYHEPSDVLPVTKAQINPDVMVAHMLAYTARIRLLSGETSVDTRNQCFDSALALGRLAATLGEETHSGWALITRRCCLEGLQVLTSGGDEVQPAAEIQSLQYLLEKLDYDRLAGSS